MENKIKETENGIVVTPDQASIEVVASYVEETLEKSEVAMRDSYKINIALDELYSNIVRYSGASEAKVSCVVDEHTVTLHLQDNGVLVKKLMSKMTYCYENGYNELTVKLQRM